MSDHGAGNGQPSPGWYPDPERPGNRRWWDGLAWTDFSEPLDGGGREGGESSPPQQGSGYGASPSGPPGSFGGGQAGYGPPQGGYGPPQGGYGPPQGGYGSPGYSGYGSYGGVPPRIDPWLWQSIVVTLLCCLPLGIVGIVFASQSQTELGRGNYGEAEAKAKQAKTFTIIGFAIGLVGVFIWIPFFVFV